MAGPAELADLLPIKMALIGGLGIGAQWLAWKLQKPAIVLMSIAGLMFGPLIGFLLAGSYPTYFGWLSFEWLSYVVEPIRPLLQAVRLDPVNDFGSVLRPVIGLAVAIILFEGGLTLQFRQISETSRAVRRMVLIVGPISWLLGTLATHYIIGLAWDISAMVGGLFVVTGPTVVIPLLRQAHLSDRPANVLKWEGIVNDPVGALFAVGAYEFVYVTHELSKASPDGGITFQAVFGVFAFAIVLSAIIGAISGWALATAFNKGIVPEYLKAPVTLAWVLVIYVLANNVGHESGLLAVTAMGMVMANMKFSAIAEMLRFKETIAILLVSGVFVILTATLTPEVIKLMFSVEGLKTIWLWVLVVILLVRPIAVFIGTAFSGLNWREQFIISWVAPRGIVAVAVSGFFAKELVEMGRDDGAIFVVLAFALVFATVLLSSFTVTPLARLLGLAKDHKDGVLVVGANPWSLGLSKALKDMDIPVIVADTNWRRLRGARQEGFDTFFGEVLSEHAEYNMDHSKFQHLIAATPNDAYNSLVCVEFAPELGRHRVFQLPGQENDEHDKQAITFTARGRLLSTANKNFDMLTQDWWSGKRFRATNITEEFTFEDMMRQRGMNAHLLLVRRPDGVIQFIAQGDKLTVPAGSKVLTFGSTRNGAAEAEKPASDGPKPLPA